MELVEIIMNFNAQVVFHNKTNIKLKIKKKTHSQFNRF